MELVYSGDQDQHIIMQEFGFTVSRSSNLGVKERELLRREGGCWFRMEEAGIVGRREKDISLISTLSFPLLVKQCPPYVRRKRKGN